MQTKTLSFNHFQVGRSGKSLLKIDSTTDKIELDQALHVLIAPNGSGKSSLFQTLAGAIPSLAGTVSLKPEEIFYTSEYLSFPKYIYPKEWVSFRTKISDIDLNAQEWVKKFHLEKPWQKYLGRMSQGERRKVVWIAAHLSTAPWVLLDEPFHGLDLLAMPVAESMIHQWVRVQKKSCWLIDHQWRGLYGQTELPQKFWYIKDGKLHSAKELNEMDRKDAERFLKILRGYFS